jgi:poly-gamma-glutamate synthesis protein (capsule biosynthesis protein)
MAGRHRFERRAAPILLAAFALSLVTLAGGAYVVLDRLGQDEPAPPAVAAEVSPQPTVGPSTTPAPSPSPTEPQRGRLVIHGTGDVNVDPNYIPALPANGWDHAWSGLDGLFERDDLTVINLECPVSDVGSPLPKEFSFRGDPAALPAMREAGVEVANLGNNHAYDYGPEALLDSIEHLREHDIAPIGAGRNPRQALAPAVFDLEGWTVAVVGIDQVVDPYPEAVAAPGHPGTAAGHDTGAMLDAIRAAEDQADIVIVTIHWGVELDTQPRAEQVALGHEFVDAGADVIFGHHAHRLQPMDHYKGRPIFWGLGNFVWPNFSAEGSTTAVAQVEVLPGGRVRGRLLPAFIESPGHPVLTG